MARKKPLCAYCGESLVGRGQCILGYDGIPGKPQVGWHVECKPGVESCLSRDHKGYVVYKLFSEWHKPKVRVSDKSIINMLNKIGARGAGRLTYNRHWVSEAAL